MADTVSRAMAYLDKLPVAVSGSGGHNATLRAACECFRFGLSESEAWDCLQWFNAYRCQPVWSEHDLRHKMADAQKIVSGHGQMAKHIGTIRRGGRPARVFVAPPAPARKVRVALPPVCQWSEAAEAAWWSDIAAQQGLTLEAFDMACGIETG